MSVFLDSVLTIMFTSEEAEKGKYTGKAVLKMDKTKVDFIMDVFKTLTNELPEQMLYREDGDSFELKTIDSIGSCLSMDLQNSGWNLIGNQIAY